MRHLRFKIDHEKLTQFCHRYHIRHLAMFGSALGKDFREDSDVDVLVEFEPGHVPGLIRLADIETDLSDIFEGRKIDLNTPLCLSRYFRDRVLAEAETLYVQGR